MNKQGDSAVIDHINNALVGDLPSFGASKESKFQQLMQQPSSQAHSGILSIPEPALSVEAQSFTPNANDLGNTHLSYGDMLSDMDALSMKAKQPNPTALEFVPRNMSAPNLVHMGMLNNMQNIPDFVPSTSRNGGYHQMAQHNVQTIEEQEPTVILEELPLSSADMFQSSPMAGQINSSVYTASRLTPSGMYFAAGDNDTSINASPHGYGGGNSTYNHMTGGLRPHPVTPDNSSPLLARRAANFHRSSPLEPIQTRGLAGDEKPIKQENHGGTTYFITPGSRNQRSQMMQHVMPSYYTFPGSPPHVEYMKQKGSSFFMPDDLRKALMQKHMFTMMTVDTEQDPTVPAEVDNYHSMYPLESIVDGPAQKSVIFGYPTSCYKAIKQKDGLPYCLRRIHGFRQVNQKCMMLVDAWKKIQHANIVSLREVFTSKAFGEHSLIFSHDYYAGAQTLMSKHFTNINNSFNGKKWGSNGTKNAGLLPERLIWRYIIQLTSALRCIHTAGLACRVMEPSKILVTDQSRIRISGVGVVDVLAYDNTHSNPRAHMPKYQQDDLMALGKVVLALACNSDTAIQPENFPSSIDLVIMNYSTDLKNLIVYLLAPQQRARSVNEVMPMIGARFYTELDMHLMRSDVIENELSKELQNGRLFRLLTKMCTINERTEFGMSAAWSETGDRYLLKLLRDQIFHQVTETGEPWVDFAHIVQSLNKLDSGVPEKVCLMSRDENNVLVVSYTDLQVALTKCFNELSNGNAAE